MTILTDNEIIERCSTDRPMIWPFYTESISSREVKGCASDRNSYSPNPNSPLINGGRLRFDGEFSKDEVAVVKSERVLSYGPSSHGYDVRIANEFKIFTNVNSTVIDPKNFDEKSFVFYEGDVCIVPPNSFALCRTMEYFIMPRDITGIVLGKCLAGNTLISDTLTGEIKEMRETSGINSVDSLNLINWTVSPQRSLGLINNGTLPTKKLKTKLGNEISATGSHPFLTWNGWVKLEDLKKGDRIAVARRESLVGNTHLSCSEAYLLGFMTADGQCDTPGSSPVFTKTEAVVMDVFKYHATAFGFTWSPRDETSVRLVNHVGRGGVPEENKATEWLKHHRLNKKSKEKTVPLAIQTGDESTIKNYLQALMACDGSFYVSKNRKCGFLEYYTTSKLLSKQVQILFRRLGVFLSFSESDKKLGERTFKAYTLRTTNVKQQQAFQDHVGFIKESKKDILLKGWLCEFAGTGRSNYDTLPNEAWPIVTRILSRLDITLSSAGLHKNDQSIPLQVLKGLSEKVTDSELTVLANQDVVWDKVISVEDDENQEVFDYTVPAFSNFVANGIIVHNSTYARTGLHCLATPMESGWEGELVLEFANTTPLPIKLYANEGAAQILFFQGKVPCRMSYADRHYGMGGKYQGQKGITLPKV